MKKEKLIDVKTLVFHIALKWRAIFLWMLIFAFLMDGYYAFNSYKDMKDQQKIIANGGSDGVVDYASELSARQIELAENSAKLYLSYKETYEEMEEYYQNSVKMQIDPLNVPTVDMLFYVPECEDVSAFATAMKTEILTESFCEDVASKLGILPAYVPELIEIEGTTNKDTDEGAFVDSSESEAENVVLYTENAIHVRMISKDKASVQQMKEVFSKQFDQCIGELQNDLAFPSVQLISSGFKYEVDNSLLKVQISCVDKMNTMNRSMKTVADDLTTVQTQYFSSLVKGGKTIDEQKEDAKNGNTQVESDNHIDVVNIKYLLIGMIIGAVLGVVYFGMKYILSDKLHDSSEVAEYHEVPLLGDLVCAEVQGHKSCKVDMFIRRMFYGKRNELSFDDTLKMICMNIENDILKSQGKAIHITGSVETESTQSVINGLAKLLPESIHCTTGKSVISDLESLDKLSKADRVVLVEEIEMSCSCDIERELEICKQYGIPIIGIVVLE